MVAKNKFEVVDGSELKKGDVVTAVDLTTGKVHKDVRLTYVSKYEGGGIDYRDTNGPGSLHRDRRTVFIRPTVVVPANWPPRPGDVWRTANGLLYVRLADSTYSKGYLIHVNESTWPTGKEDEILKRHPDLTLVYRA